MNPRGCADSPLTTARLFTAADSDDICTAIQFINKARPWTTLMGVGWGYGANMLTKYLAEVGEGTPLTAAACIDNPFDLEEATRSFPHHMATDHKLTDGLVDILRSNKELFRGRAKGFDVEKALSAKSVRDFEKAISMVSYGFEAIEDFYSKSSTRNLIGNVKIPVLFIQNDDGSAPLFSIPRSSVAENPFTSLLLCSCLPSSGIYGGRSAMTWCQQLTIEWLTAVELGLLKGRHPLLKDVDITINPSKGLAFMEGKQSRKNGKVTKLLDFTPSNSLNRYTKDTINNVLEESDTTASLILRSRKDLQRKYEVEDKGLGKIENGALEQTNSIDTELVQQEEVSPIESESGEVLQTAQVVMNMLDVTMPGTLTEEKKKKVLTTVGQGETLMKALEDAVPEDVREKLTTAVSGILRAQGPQMKINELLDISRIPNVSTGLKSKLEEKFRGTSNTEGGLQDQHSSEQMKKTDNLSDSSTNNQPGVQKPSGGMDSEHLQMENSQKSANLGQSQSTSSDENNNSGFVRTEASDSGTDVNYDDSSKGKGVVNSEKVEKGSETGAKANSSSSAEKASNAEEANVEEHKDQNEKTALSDTKEEHSAKNEEKSVPDQNKTTAVSSSGVIGENTSPSGSSSEAQSTEKEDSDDNKNMQPVLDQSKSSSDSSTFSVSQALGALTGMDDSTQVAVNSVFGVIENMISQLEESSEHEDEDKDEKNNSRSVSVSMNVKPIDGQRQEKSEATLHEKSVKPDGLSDSSVLKHCGNSMDSRQDESNGRIEKESTQSPISSHGNGMKSRERDTATRVVEQENRKNDQLGGSNHPDDSLDRIKKENSIPTYITSNNEYLPKYLFSEIPTESLDSDATNALLLEYFPEEGQWKLLEQPGNNGSTVDDAQKKVHTRSPAEEDDGDDVIEPLYVILDTEQQQEPIEEFETLSHEQEKVAIDDNIPEELMQFVREIILVALKVEVGRKLSTAGMNEIEPKLVGELVQVANAVSLSVGHDVKHALISDAKCHDIDDILDKVDTLNGEHIIRVISSAVQETTYLRRVLPVGVIVGSSLAALRKVFNVSTVHDDGDLNFAEDKKLRENDYSKIKVSKTHQMPSEKIDQNNRMDDLVSKKGGKTELYNKKNATVMVGAVTAALGASALLVQHRDSYKSNEAVESSSKSPNMKADTRKEAEKLDEAASEKNHNNIVTSLAEKAMSVASPVVPTKEDGGVDQERLVAMLADLGQRGGMLRLVGKVALLWGGIRGAMSLTDRLISFLRLAERSLIQRVLGFVSMVLVLWSPVAVPLLPTLVQSWTTRTPSRFAELVCIIGLYTAVMILVMLWGKRIRGFENPLEQYGLDLASLPKIQNFLKGLVGGVMLVVSIQAVNVLLGCVNISWPYTPSSVDAMTWLKWYGRMLVVVAQGIVTASGVALVEELLFRSWLPEEIAADLGHHRGMIISGLIFSLFERSLWAIPGLWLLSLSLSGVRQRTEGSLSLPIGLRAGIMASSFILQKGGVLTYKPNFPIWVTGTHSFQPFSGIAGFAFSLLLALFLYPRQPIQTKNLKCENGE
ncbi:uncharacterized protein LOC21402490 [Morus notabilis]|nr:uncharacterized protein LOC21402490 [Morus notabilis]